MKKYIIPILVIALTAVSCSQKRLDIEQKGVVSYEAFYDGSDESCQSAVTSMYDQAIRTTGNYRIYVPMNYLFSLPGDDVYAGGGQYGDCDYAGQISDFRTDVTNEVCSNFYGESYQIIYTANLVIDNFEPSTPAKKDLIAQARAMRAAYHLYLAIAFGTPPLVDHVLSATDKPGNSDHQELLKWCAEELEAAAADLTERASTEDKALTYRWSKGAAYAFAGKARLFMGDFNGAKSDLEKVINSGKYALVPGNKLHSLWEVDGDGSAEKIFEYNIDFNSSIPVWGSGVTAQIVHTTWMAAHSGNWRWDHTAGIPSDMYNQGWGFSGVTKKYAEALINNDGMDSDRRKAFIKTYDEALGISGNPETDLAYPTDAACPTLEDKKKDPARGSSTAAGMFCVEGYLTWKTISLAKDIRQGMWNDRNFHLMRYAEVLLMYAEACAQLGETSGAGLAALNAIQTRAGAKHVSTTLNMTEVKNEKFLEMFNEGCRWADLVRWGDAAKELASMGEEHPMQRDRMFTDGAATHEGYVVYEKNNSKLEHGFKTGKHELMPFPYSATSVNENLKQNPGY